jgi:hypothetical protein
VVEHGLPEHSPLSPTQPVGEAENTAQALGPAPTHGLNRAGEEVPSAVGIRPAGVNAGLGDSPQDVVVALGCMLGPYTGGGTGGSGTGGDLRRGWCSMGSE